MLTHHRGAGNKETVLINGTRRRRRNGPNNYHHTTRPAGGLPWQRPRLVRVRT